MQLMPLPFGGTGILAARVSSRRPVDAAHLPASAAADPLSQQALEVQAQDLALEDALYALDKSLNAAAVEPDAYLKQVGTALRCGGAAHTSCQSAEASPVRANLAPSIKPR